MYLTLCTSVIGRLSMFSVASSDLQHHHVDPCRRNCPICASQDPRTRFFVAERTRSDRRDELDQTLSLVNGGRVGKMPSHVGQLW